jgi:hypothetical protein
MRFPRISRLRWDKPPREADRLEALEKMLDSSATSAPRTSPRKGAGRRRDAATIDS